MKTVVEMAREAGFNPVNYMGSNLELFERFAELVRADERAKMVSDKSKETMKLALEALESMAKTLAEHEEPTTFNEDEAMSALREVLAEQPAPVQQELVGALTLGGIIDASDGPEYEEWDVEWNSKAIEALQDRLVTGDPVTLEIYTSPPAQRKPLTDEQIENIFNNWPTYHLDHYEFARAIEAAHNIKENT